MKRLLTVTCAAFFLTAPAHAQSPDEYDDGIAAGQLGTALYNLTNPARPLPMPAADVLQDPGVPQRPASAPRSTSSTIKPAAHVEPRQCAPCD
jgi:hypothetical protein